MSVRASVMVSALLLLSAYGLVPMIVHPASASKPPPPPSRICGKTGVATTDFNGRHDLLLTMRAGVCGTVGNSGTFTSVTHSVNLTIFGPDDWNNTLFQYKFSGYTNGVVNYSPGGTYVGDALTWNLSGYTFIQTFSGVNLDLARTNGTWTVYDYTITHKHWTISASASISVVDVPVTSILPLKRFGYNCGLSCNNYTFYPIGVVVTVQNQGNLTESFNVTLAAGSTIIGTLPLVGLSPGQQGNVTFNWKAQLIGVGNYTLSAYTWRLRPDEVNTTNNMLSYGVFPIHKAGDVNWDGVVDVNDEVLVQNHIGTTNQSDIARYDINNDGAVGRDDLNITYQNQFT